MCSPLSVSSESFPCPKVKDVNDFTRAFTSQSLNGNTSKYQLHKFEYRENVVHGNDLRIIFWEIELLSALN